MKNRNYAQEEMISSYADWQQSKPCKAAYCQQVGLAKSTFSYWVRKLKLGAQLDTSTYLPAAHLHQNSLSWMYLERENRYSSRDRLS